MICALAPQTLAFCDIECFFLITQKGNIKLFAMAVTICLRSHVRNRKGKQVAIQNDSPERDIWRVLW